MNQENVKQKMNPVFHRLLHYLILFVLSLLVYNVMKADYSQFEQIEEISMIMGYMAFLFLAITLLIGPISRWLPGKASGYLLKSRRDVGIWTGILVILHVVSVVIVFNEGRDYYFLEDNRFAAEGWLGLFFNQDPESGKLFFQKGILAIANYLGVVALLFLLAMLFTSSSRAEQLLGGASWKRVHSSNLLVFLLIFFHGQIYINWIKSSPPQYFVWMIWIVIFVLIVRLTTFIATVVKRKRT